MYSAQKGSKMQSNYQKYSLKKIITDFLKEFPDTVEIFIFGSRRYKTRSIRSDMDLLIFGEHSLNPIAVRDFANKTCKYLDFFIADEKGSAVSCANSSFISEKNRKQLIRKLNCLLVWNNKKGFSNEDIDWDFNTLLDYAPMMSTMLLPPKTKIDYKKVFIVHGHDEDAKLEIKNFITSLGLEPIILSEQSNKGMTIIEKIETNTDVGLGIVLYTPCDEGRLKNDNKKTPLNSRARQNVIFEHGYLIGKLGRSRVVALVKDKIEKPNDIEGVIYIQMDKKERWKNDVIKELKDAGYILNHK
jgi:predicted nucleotide-binding protein/predicted nucleotidyltransferase